MTEFAQWLANELDKRDWKQADFAREGKFKPQNVSRWVMASAQPSYMSARRIAEVLRIPEDEVLVRAGHKAAGGGISRPRSPVDDLRAALQRMPRAIPHYDQLVSAGEGEPMIDGYVYLDQDEYVGPNDYSLTVTGECMDPEISPGDHIVVNPDAVPEVGRIVIFTLDDEKVLLKRLVMRDGQRWLEPRNGVPIPYDQRVRFKGILRRVIKRY